MNFGLWQKISDGDRTAYSEAYFHYYRRLYNYGRKFTQNDPLIEDAIQEIFLHLWQNRNKIPAINNPQSYFFYAFRNTLFQKLKQEKKKETVAAISEPDPVFNIESILISHEMEGEKRKALDAALRTLPARQREIIFLRFYEGLSYDQIAEVMHITVNSTYKMISKGLNHLRETMQLPFGSVLLLLMELR